MHKKFLVLLLVLIALMFAGCEDTGSAYLKEKTPDWAGDYIGMWGMVRNYGFDQAVAEPPICGIDFWHCQNYIIHNEKTAPHLYSDYTPLKVNYKKGTLPVFEKIVEKYTTAQMTDTQKATALLTKAMPDTIRHLAIPPVCKRIPTCRGLSDDELIESSEAWCNEQARVFIRLCQTAGIPARMIFLSYSNRRNGHVISEFYADGRWSMADSSYLITFPAPGGHLMSAAECHTEGLKKDLADNRYLLRMNEILTYSDQYIAQYGVEADLPEEERTQKIAEKAKIVRNWQQGEIDNYYDTQLWMFGVMNYPLPK